MLTGKTITWFLDNWVSLEHCCMILKLQTVSDDKLFWKAISAIVVALSNLNCLTSPALKFEPLAKKVCSLLRQESTMFPALGYVSAHSVKETSLVLVLK